MTHYLVRAYPDHERLPDLLDKLHRGRIQELEPFGRHLDEALRGAKIDPEDGRALWEEEDHCSPPLAMERQAVLDEHFDEIEVEPVDPGEGWDRIEDLPSLWFRANRDGTLPGNS